MGRCYKDGRTRLTEEQVDEILGRAEKGEKAHAIARALNVRPSTVYWRMIKNGYASPAQTDAPRVVVRNGVEVRGFSRAEDAFMVERSMAGDKPRAIAVAFEAQFGRAVRAHSIDVRLAMLACLDDNGLGVAA